MGSASSCVTPTISDECPAEPTRSYLDELPTEVHYNVIRHLSSTPRASSWQGGVSLADAMAVLCSDSMGEEARRTFPALATGTEGSWKSSEHSSSLLVSHESARTEVIHAARFLRRAPEFVTRASLSARHASYRLARALEPQALRTLALSNLRGRFNLRRALSSCEATLSTLELSGYLTCEHARAVARCSELRTLRLRVERGWSALAPMWPGLSQLRSLSLGSPFGYGQSWDTLGEMLLIVREHCVRIGRLEFDRFPNETHETIMGFAARYGEQLTTFKMPNCYVDANAWRDLLVQCCNVRVEAHMYAEAMVRTLDALGKHVHTLRVVGDDMDVFTGDLQRLPDVAEKCVNLSRVSVRPNELHPDRLGDVLTVLQTCHRRVHTLELIDQHHFVFEVPPNTRACSSRGIREAVEKCTMLRFLHVSSEMPTVGMFDRVAQACQKLEKVRVRIVTLSCTLDEPVLDEKDVDVALAGVVRSFAACPGLCSLKVDVNGAVGTFMHPDKLPRISEACRKLAHRRLVVHMLEVKYLQ